MMNISDLNKQEKDRNILSDELFRMIRDIIYKECGIYFADSKRYFLENRIAKRVEKCEMESFEEYYVFLKEGGENHSQKKELSILIDAITVSETSFFRNEPQLDVLKHHIFPAVIENNRDLKNNVVKVWSAGCSTGEEPYTIAMMLLEESGFLKKNINIRIIATDISDKALEYAEKGKYRDNTLRRVPVPYLEKYFIYDGDLCFMVKDNVKDMVTFKNANLLDEKGVKYLRNFDIVFCRNVIIYFDDIVKKRVIKNLTESIRPGGYLFVGHSESLRRISDSFRLLSFEKAQVYKKL